MKKLVIDLENPNGVLVDLTDAEKSQLETDKVNGTAEMEALETAKQNQENLKASAKAKLIAGEALTEEEANTIVL
tara:strand:- start:1436 stop:1660 length:225 start_codon:yes stop_codon:yes gene_type:complete